MLALLLAFFVPQEPTVLVSGVMRERELPASAFGLGDGGLGQPVAGTRTLKPGQVVTKGGILVRAQAEGTKLDFPSGGELLITRAGRVHLRTGESTLPAFHGLTLKLADGERVWIHGDEVSVGQTVLRRQTAGVPREAHEASSLQQDQGIVLHALGDGTVLYRLTARGPILELQRVLCAGTRGSEFPTRKLVVLGDVLAESLRRLPARVPHAADDFPEAPDIAQTLAKVSRSLFAPGQSAKSGQGETAFALAMEFRLTIGSLESKPILITLRRGRAETPCAEWSIGPRTLVHLTRPDGRHYAREVDVTELLPAK